MKPKAILLYSEKLEETDLNLHKLANFLGIECHVSPLTEWINEVRNSLKNHVAVMASGKTIAALYRMYNTSGEGVISTLGNPHSMLIYELYPSNSLLSSIARLSGNIVQAISEFRHSNYQYVVSKDYREICGPLSGLKFGPIKNDIDFGLDGQHERDDVHSLISINGKHLFLKFRKGRCDIYLLSCKRVIDIEVRINSSFDVRNSFSQVAPILMFFKYVFRNFCWHNNRNMACLIIDDPLLHPNYGFLNYENLLKLLDDYNFSTSIAFIPWNYKRTKGSVSNMFRERPEKLGINIHGCDHTKDEFGSTDYLELNNKVRLAKKRMKIHKQKTGVRFDDVMIFPQGIFSEQALKVLKSNNVLAAVNTEVIPYKSQVGIEISQLINLAITKYCKFPLLTRRYPSDGVENFAFDLFIGKPCLIVIHQDYLRRGYKELINLIQSIKSLEQNLFWDGLENIIRRACLSKINTNGNIAVKMYANYLELENPSDKKRKYIVTKEETSEVPIRSIKVNRKEIDYTFDGQSVQFSLDIKPKQKAVVEIVNVNMYPETKRREKINYRIRVAVRRHLSEIRDKLLFKYDKYEILMRVINKIKGLADRVKLLLFL